MFARGRGVRRGAALAGLAGLGAVLGAALLAAPTVSSASTAERECAPGTGGSAARLAAGSDAVDPSASRPANARSLDRAVQRESSRLLQRAMRRGGDEIAIPTYVHVISRPGIKNGVSRAKVREQVEVLNVAFAGKTAKTAKPTPFRFKLVGIDYTVDHSKDRHLYNWRLTRNGTEPVKIRSLKAKLHRGGPESLNIYITGLSDGLLGYATFPGEGNPRLDGVVLLDRTLPGGTSAPYNQGDTAVHEIGHWLGLYHTFQGGCVDPAGDLVGDTPFHDDGENVYQCGTLDTCPLPGKDPTTNFMSYGNDACLNRFTVGQVQRQTATWYAMRDASV